MERQPTPIFLPGEFHEQRSLVGYSPWGHKELDTAEWLTNWQGHITCWKVHSGPSVEHEQKPAGLEAGRTGRMIPLSRLGVHKRTRAGGWGGVHGIRIAYWLHTGDEEERWVKDESQISSLNIRVKGEVIFLERERRRLGVEEEGKTMNSISYKWNLRGLWNSQVNAWQKKLDMGFAQITIISTTVGKNPLEEME